ncbi:MAG: SagB/ThcOx family dehydrogenase [Alphaproteobacteria bacterium]
MKNRESSAAWKYHNGTKHSYQSIRTNPHYLDWENQPIPFKIYSKLEPMPLSQQLSSSEMPALSAIAAVDTTLSKAVFPTSQILAEILFLCAGVTKRRSYPGGEMLFRAAACTGALYHIDLYLVCRDLDHIEAGVYHFAPHDFALRRMRQGDYRGVLARATGEEASITRAPCTLVCASTYWRNAWKYQARAYRHCYWDNGTILANLLAAAASHHVPAKIVVGFVDAEVNQLLGLDPRREAALSLVALGRTSPGPVGAPPQSEALSLESVPLSKEEIDYPAITAMHEASSLQDEQEVRAWREEQKAQGEKIEEQWEQEKRVFSLQPLQESEIPQESIEATILRRGSTREFARDSISFTQLSTMLDRATRGLPADFPGPAAPPLNDVYLIVHAVDGLVPGAYYFRKRERTLALLKEGNFRREAGYLGLGQEIPADCSVNVYFLTDLASVLARFGNRGYRAAQLEAGITGGKFYLAAYAQRLGASGLTFFDDEVTEFFSPHAAGKSVMFLVALGKSAKRKA